MKEVEENPLHFLDKLKHGENLNIPDLQRIIEVPNIDWGKFKLHVPENCINEIKGDSMVNKNFKITTNMEDNYSSANTHSKVHLKENKCYLILVPSIYNFH